jgi:hypothetical protein
VAFTSTPDQNKIEITHNARIITISTDFVVNVARRPAFQRLPPAPGLSPKAL